MSTACVSLAHGSISRQPCTNMMQAIVQQGPEAHFDAQASLSNILESLKRAMFQPFSELTDLCLRGS